MDVHLFKKSIVWTSAGKVI